MDNSGMGLGPMNITKTYRKLRRKMWWWFAWKLFPQQYYWGASGNRRWRVARTGDFNQRLTFIVTDLAKEGGYSREDLYKMLIVIRQAERKMGWTVPEPDETMMGIEVELRGIG